MPGVEDFIVKSNEINALKRNFIAVKHC